jgi:hypothetical protein
MELRRDSDLDTDRRRTSRRRISTPRRDLPDADRRRTLVPTEIPPHAGTSPTQTADAPRVGGFLGPAPLYTPAATPTAMPSANPSQTPTATPKAMPSVTSRPTRRRRPQPRPRPRHRSRLRSTRRRSRRPRRDIPDAHRADARHADGFLSRTGTSPTRTADAHRADGLSVPHRDLPMRTADALCADGFSVPHRDLPMRTADALCADGLSVPHRDTPEADRRRTSRRRTLVARQDFADAHRCQTPPPASNRLSAQNAPLTRGAPRAPLKPRHRVDGSSTHAGSCRTIGRPRRSPLASRKSSCRRRCTSRRWLYPCASPTLAETADAPCADGPTARSAALAVGAVRVDGA